MPDSVENDAQKAINSLKSNRTGNLELKNGKLAIDTGTSVYYTTAYGTPTFEGESVRNDEADELTRAESHPTATGDLYLQNGNLYLTNETGQVTLVG